MARELDEETAQSVRADARRAEFEADATGSYPEGTTISSPNRPSRMFNLRLSAEQFGELQELARQRHLPVSTMARAWLLERLDSERRAS